jgi:hypothetical protein
VVGYHHNDFGSNSYFSIVFALSNKQLHVFRDVKFQQGKMLGVFKSIL